MAQSQTPRLPQGPPGHPDQVSSWRPPCLRTSPHSPGAQHTEPSRTSQPLRAAGPEAPTRTSPIHCGLSQQQPWTHRVLQDTCGQSTVAHGFRMTTRTSEGTLPGDVLCPAPQIIQTLHQQLGGMRSEATGRAETCLLSTGVPWGHGLTSGTSWGSHPLDAGNVVTSSPPPAFYRRDGRDHRRGEGTGPAAPAVCTCSRRHSNWSRMQRLPRQHHPLAHPPVLPAEPVQGPRGPGRGPPGSGKLERWTHRCRQTALEHLYRTAWTCRTR